MRSGERGGSACAEPGSPWPVSTLKNQRSLMAENGEAMEVILHWGLRRQYGEQYGLSFGEGLRVYVDAQMQLPGAGAELPAVRSVRHAQRTVARGGRSETAGILR